MFFVYFRLSHSSKVRGKAVNAAVDPYKWVREEFESSVSSGEFLSLTLRWASMNIRKLFTDVLCIRPIRAGHSFISKKYIT